jgi:hypothetical protein
LFLECWQCDMTAAVATSSSSNSTMKKF